MELLNFLLALLPIIWLGFALIALKIPAFKAAFGSLIIAGLLAVFFWKLSLLNTVTAGAEGFLMALWPIILVILAAVFTYRLSLHTGAMDIIKKYIRRLLTRALVAESVAGQLMSLINNVAPHGRVALCDPA